MTTSTRKSARTSTPRNTPLPAVTGTVKLVQPLGETAKDAAVIAINGQTYLCQCIGHYALTGYDAVKEQPTRYDLPADLSTCECMDFLHRAHRRDDGKCKHQKAIAALIGKGKLTDLTCMVDEVEFDEDADLAAWDAMDDSEAEAWHSQYDAA